MLSPALKEVLQVVTPIASVLIAVVAICAAYWLNVPQRRIQEAQLNNSLFDRRFAVYEAAGQYITTIMQKNGALDTFDLQGYLSVVEKGELLFGADTKVTDFLKDLQKRANEVYVKTAEAKQLHKSGNDATPENLEIGEMMKDFFSGSVQQRRIASFRPYLTLQDSTTR